MSKFNEIISGWKNVIFKNKETELLAKNRIKKCIECPQLTKRNTCGVCGCYMPAKVRSEKSNCPKGYW